MKLQLKRSQILSDSTPGAQKPQQPSILAMLEGEIAVNYNAGDPALFIKEADGNVVRLDGNQKTYSIEQVNGELQLVHNGSGRNDKTVESAIKLVAGPGVTITGNGDIIEIKVAADLREEIDSLKARVAALES